MINPDDAAFPRNVPAGFSVPGLSKREYFAVHILVGFFAVCAGNPLPRARDSAEIALYYADALIAALNEPPKSEEGDI